MRRAVILAAVVTALPAAAATEPPRIAAPTIVRGTVVGLTPPPPPIVRDAVTTILPAEIMVKTDAGVVTVLVAAGSRTLAATRSGFDALVTNAVIGTVVRRRRGGVVEATEVHLLPDSLRAETQGIRPYDAATTLTVGTIARVGTIKHHAGRTMTVTAGGTTQEIVVPANAPIVTLVDAAPGALVVGSHVTVATSRTAEGRTAAAAQVVVGAATVPPL